MRRQPTPLARAVRMNSLPSAPSIAARVMRASGASAKIAMVTAGSTNWPIAERNIAQSPASNASMVKKPVMLGGPVRKGSSLPIGSGELCSV